MYFNSYCAQFIAHIVPLFQQWLKTYMHHTSNVKTTAATLNDTSVLRSIPSSAISCSPETRHSIYSGKLRSKCTRSQFPAGNETLSHLAGLVPRSAPRM